MKSNQKGFSLVELLVVVIIIGIIAAIAIPSLLASRKAANEASAVANLRTIHSAQVTYLAVQGNNTTYGTFAQLSGTPKLIDTSWGAATVTKNTYTYTLSLGTGIYCAAATSTDTTARDYGVDQEGTLYQGANAAAACAAGDLTGITTVVGS